MRVYKIKFQNYESQTITHECTVNNWPRCRQRKSQVLFLEKYCQEKIEDARGSRCVMLNQIRMEIGFTRNWRVLPRQLVNFSSCPPFPLPPQYHHFSAETGGDPQLPDQEDSEVFKTI